MNRCKNFNKLSGGFLFDRVHNSIKTIEPVVDKTEKNIIPNEPVIITPPPAMIGNGSKQPNKDPAYRLRKLALKSKKVVVEKKKYGGKYRTGYEVEEPEMSSGKGLEKYLNVLPKDILGVVSKLQSSGILLPILKMAKHIK